MLPNLSLLPKPLGNHLPSTRKIQPLMCDTFPGVPILASRPFPHNFRHRCSLQASNKFRRFGWLDSFVRMVYYRFWPEFLPKNYIDKTTRKTIITNHHQFQGESSRKKKTITFSSRRFPPFPKHTCAQHLAVSVQCVGGSPWELAAHVWDISRLLVFTTQNAICQRKKTLQKDGIATCLLLLFFELFHDISWRKNAPNLNPWLLDLDIQRPHVFMSTRNVQIDNDYMYGSRCMKDFKRINLVRIPAKKSYQTTQTQAHS